MFCSQCGNQLSDEAVFCPKCGTPTANNHVAGQQRVIDKGKVMKNIAFEIVTSILLSAIAGFAVSLFIKDFLDNTLAFVIEVALYWGLLEAIPGVLVIIRRAIDPEDTAYVLGSTQDEEANKRFEEKYTRFKSVMGTIITIITTVLFFSSLYTNLSMEYPKEIRELTNMFKELVGLG